MRLIATMGMYLCLWGSNYVGKNDPESTLSYLMILGAFFAFDMLRVSLELK